MSEPQIVCPKCRNPIRLTDSLAAPLLAKTRKQFEHRLAQQEADLAKRATELRKRKDELTKAHKAIDEAVAKKLASARTAIAKAEAQKLAAPWPAISRSATTSSMSCSGISTPTPPSWQTRKKPGRDIAQGPGT